MNRADKLAREAIARRLPHDFLNPRPIEALWCVPLFLLAVLGTRLIIATGWPWPILTIISLLLGNLYASFFFLGHYIVHGANTQSKILQRLLGFVCFAPLGMSPHLWKVWHHTMHHPLTNYPGRDPDNFGDIQHQRARPIPHLFIPGNRRVIPSLVFLTLFFTGHVLSVLFIYSRGKHFSRLNKKKAYAETTAIALLAITLALLSGKLAVWTVLIPWLVANVVGVSYTVTQHLLLPLTRSSASLDCSMSVRVPMLLDLIHFFNSHHVEHHLFPEASMKGLRQIRAALRGTPNFKCVPMWRALVGVWRTPRFHDGDCLVDHKTGHRVPFHVIDNYLFRGVKL